MKKILAVIGARPQFIKHAPFEIAAKGKIELITIHTGQHFDANMSQVFFEQLGMDAPKYQLNTGGGAHGEQTGKMLQEIEPIVIKEKPDYMLVYGDTNSTIAGALVASKLHIPVIHVEAGLRSFNKKMPEEINRILTDHISDLLFTSTDGAVTNLRDEGIVKGVHKLGDIMADSVMVAQKVIDKKGSPKDYPYYFVTVHRPYNTDDKGRLINLLHVLNTLNEKVIFPLHPRTRNLSKEYGLDLSNFHNIEFCDPLSYFDNIQYLKYAIHAITDSGGLQKEAYILKVPCITVRSETEWVETLENGWNILCFDDLNQIPNHLSRNIGNYVDNIYGNGKASQEIVELILSHKNESR